MEKVIILNPREILVQNIFAAFMSEATSKEDYYRFRPYKHHIQNFLLKDKSNQLGVNDLVLDKLDELCNPTESNLMYELYKLISNENRENIFNYIFTRFDIKTNDKIYINYYLKYKTDSSGIWYHDLEGIFFYNFLKKIKKIPEKNITILIDSSEEYLVNEIKKNGIEFYCSNFYTYDLGMYNFKNLFTYKNPVR